MKLVKSRMVNFIYDKIDDSLDCKIYDKFSPFVEIPELRRSEINLSRNYGNVIHRNIIYNRFSYKNFYRI